MPPYFYRMYECFFNALSDPRWPDYFDMVITAEIRDINGFIRAIRSGLVVISAQLCADGLYYTGSVHMRSGVEQIVRVHARDLGLDDQDVERGAVGGPPRAGQRPDARQPGRDHALKIVVAREKACPPGVAVQRRLGRAEPPSAGWRLHHSPPLRRRTSLSRSAAAITAGACSRPGCRESRSIGPETLTAAMTFPEGERTGAETDATPGSRSPTEWAQPRRRTAARATAE